MLTSCESHLFDEAFNPFTHRSNLKQQKLDLAIVEHRHTQHS